MDAGITMDNHRLFETLGFQWDRAILPASVPVHTVERAVFRLHKSLPEYVWDAAMLEGNPFTFPEVLTLLDGVTVGGHKISNEQQVLNLANSAKKLLQLVRTDTFTLTKQTSDALHAIIARDEAFDAGFFRGEGEERRITPRVVLGEFGSHTPVTTEPGGGNLRDLHERGLAAINTLDNPFEQAIAYFLFGALHMVYFGRNKATARYMMNGHLMSGGIDAISIPAARAWEFNERMVDFYRFRDGTAMFAFLARCHPDADLLFPAP